MMKHLLMSFYLTILSTLLFAQTGKALYVEAYEHLYEMLEDKNSLNIKDAVFLVESAYLDGRLSREWYDKQIEFLSDMVIRYKAANELLYEHKDKEEVARFAAIFKVMTDTIPILYKEDTLYHYPFTYDFDDIWGLSAWENMFVFKLLDSKKGNCHSLPLLYKILAEETSTQAYLAIAPNHFYIKHHSRSMGWFNTELTSGIFPVDAWLMASGYIHLDAISNGLYMEALSNSQVIAVCLVDLAQGYIRKFGVGDGTFVMNCLETALANYSNYINAMLIRADTSFELLKQDKLPADKTNMAKVEALYAEIHELGYRRMPEGMYLDWLLSLKTERNKYENKKISNFNAKSE